jgi:hypothetical protein
MVIVVAADSRAFHLADQLEALRPGRGRTRQYRPRQTAASTFWRFMSACTAFNASRLEWMSEKIAYFIREGHSKGCNERPRNKQGKAPSGPERPDPLNGLNGLFF